MATPAQILANRQNALKSTGPRTEEGKAVSRFNALKTGIHAKSMVIRGEDAAELEKLAADYHTRFQPADPVERFLVDSMVNAEWQLRRFRKVEAGLWEFTLSGQESGLGESYGENLQVFTRLHRRIEAIERSYHRSLRELRRLQKERTTDVTEEAVAEEALVAETLTGESGRDTAHQPTGELASIRQISAQPEISRPAPAVNAPREENLALRL